MNPTNCLSDAAQQRVDGELRLADASPQDSCGRVPSGRTQLQKGRPGFWILVHSDDFTKL